MNTTLREVLARQADNAGLPDLDVDELVGLGEERLRRRRLSALLGGTVVLVLVIAVAIGAMRGGPVKDSNGPVKGPTPSPTDTAPPLRKIVYSTGYTSTTIHFGDRVVETGNGHVHMDVTDDGFVYTAAGSVWFSDGGRPVRVGSHVCGAGPTGEFSNFSDVALSGNVGSAVAWFDCAEPARPDLVVFDTDSLSETVREALPLCAKRRCELDAVIGAHVYFTEYNYAPRMLRRLRLDLATREVSATTGRAYAEDVRAHRRNLLVGDSWATARPSDGLTVPRGNPPHLQGFQAIGSRLIPLARDAERNSTNAFDTTTGQALDLRLPRAYSDGSQFILFEWLDDHTVALMGGGRGDIITCRLPDGPCDLAVSGPKGAGPRVVPGWPLPG